MAKTGTALPTKAARVVFTSGSNTTHEAVLNRINNSWGRVSRLKVPEGTLGFLSWPDTPGALPVPCSAGITDDCGTEFIFDQPIDGRLVDDLVFEHAIERSSAHTNLLHTDYTDINEEVREIQSCRSNVFLATLGCVFTAGFATWGLAIEGKIGPTGLLFGTGIGFALFIIGILSSVEKARAINIRRGFLAAITPYLTGDLELTNYLGWGHYRFSCSSCGDLRRAKTCGDTAHKKCKAARKEAEALNRMRRPIPSVLDSFMSLSSTVYVCIYLITTIVFGHALGQVAKKSLSADQALAFCMFAAGVLLGPLAVKFAVPVLTLFVCSIAIAVTVVTAVTGVVPWSVFGLALSVGAGALVGVLGFGLFVQMNKARRGSHSVYSHYCRWRVAIALCAPFPDPSLVPTDLKRKWYYRVLDWFLSPRHWGKKRSQIVQNEDADEE